MLLVEVRGKITSDYIAQQEKLLNINMIEETWKDKS